MKRLHIIGAGALVEQTYLPALNFLKSKYNEYEISSIIDLNIDRAKNLAFNNNIKNYSNALHKDNLNKEDVILIATPPSSHFSIVESFITNHNINILCEKPFLLSSMDYNKLESILNDNYPLYIAHIKRLYPSVQLLKNFLHSNILGNIKSIEIYDGFVFKWDISSNYVESNDDSGGVLYDIGSHDLDLLLYILGLDDASDIMLHIKSLESNYSTNESLIKGNFTLKKDSKDLEIKFFFSRLNQLSNQIKFIFESGIVLYLPLSYSDNFELTKNNINFQVTNPDNKIVDEINSTNDCFLKEIKILFHGNQEDKSNALHYKKFKNTTYLLEQLNKFKRLNHE